MMSSTNQQSESANIPQKANISEPPEYVEDSIQIVQEKLRQAFQLVGLDPEPILKDILRDPYALEADTRPIVREVCVATIRMHEMQSQAIDTEATSSLESLKMYVDQSIEHLQSLMISAAADILDDRDTPHMYRICMNAYKKRSHEFQILLREEVDKLGGNGAGCHGYFEHSFEAAKAMALKARNSEKHLPKFNVARIHMIESSTTRDELFAALCMDKHPMYSGGGTYSILKPAFDRARAGAMETFRECLKGEYEDQVRPFCLNDAMGRFTSYCLENYPRVVEQKFCFDGDADAEPKAAYRHLMAEWKQLSPKAKNEYGGVPHE